MLDYLKKVLTAEKVQREIDNSVQLEKPDIKKKLQVATAALFVELAKADGEFSDEERDAVIKLLKEQFNLEDECVKELIELSQQELDKSISLYGFSKIINENLTPEEKFELMKNLWRLIYTDKKLDKFEDRMIKLLGGMLYLDHNQIINAKLLVRDEMGIE